jgi:hypothetical protein
MKPVTVHPVSLVVGCVSAVALGLLMSMQQITAQRIQILSPEEMEILSHMSIVYLPDGQGGQAKTIRVSGVNLQVVNGLGATNGNPASPSTIVPFMVQTNGVGNLIVGYNELTNPHEGDDRTGSHNVVVGYGNDYSSFGGLVIGRLNRISGMYASISGGSQNHVAGLDASVSGGSFNDADGEQSSVSGGRANTAYSDHSSVSGGASNWAGGVYAAISGGYSSSAYGEYSSISGGQDNTANSDYSSISGGQDNTIDGAAASICGGYANTADGALSTVTGGSNNDANGLCSSVSGGLGRACNDSYDWRGGGLWENQ